MPVRRLARTIDAALRDAGRARHAQRDPKFRKDVQTDRRGTLRKFETVEHALQDRARIENAKASGKSGTAPAKTSKAKAKKK